MHHHQKSQSATESYVSTWISIGNRQGTRGGGWATIELEDVTSYHRKSSSTPPPWKLSTKAVHLVRWRTEAVPPHHCRPKVWNDEWFWCIGSHAHRAWRMEPSCTTISRLKPGHEVPALSLIVIFVLFLRGIQVLVSSDISTSRKY